MTASTISSPPLPLPTTYLRSPDIFVLRSFPILISGHLRSNLIHSLAMAVTFYNLSSQSGLKKLDEYLLTRSYITGYQDSKDDIIVHAAL
ncbi:hypothetical protein F0562_035063 [Nyssa sinensis]|uniref:Uncharacterized protein n=1 Tax=Nyssa sinensis TaxID=561372 RepID=A0A5J5AD53_9ASTE|nr:hypothetical protein F0562_035063 [Nyssa sinensis]